MTSISSTSSLLSASTSSSSSTSSTSTSDIDWNGLIEVAVQAKLAKADTIDTKITANEAKIAAYQQMQSLLGDVKTAAQAMRAPSGTTAKTDDVFLDRTAYLTANGSVDAASSVSATVASGAAIGQYDLTINQLAKAHKVAGGSVTSNTADLGYSGVIKLGTDGGSAAEITIDSSMSLAEVAEAINARTGATGVQATVLKVSSSAFELILSAKETGQTITAGAVSGDDVLTNLGLLNEDGGFANVLQQPAQAIITLDGVEITRSTNDISDVLDGVTFHLYQTTPDNTSITVDVGNDLSAVKSALQSLVDAYNAYRDFAYAQQQVTSGGTASSDAVLFSDATLRNINAAIASALNTSVGDTALQSLGLSFDSTNHLSLDTSALDDVLLSDLDALRSLLSFQMTSSSSNLMLLSRGTAAVGDFKLDITVGSDGSITSAAVDGDTSPFTISGTRIIGAAGTRYEGYTFVFTGTASQSIDVSTSAGIAELLYNAANAAASSTNGTLQGLVDNLEGADATLKAKSDDIRSRTETYRTNLTAQYARYQAAIEAAESSQTYLTALIDSWNSSS